LYLFLLRNQGVARSGSNTCNVQIDNVRALQALVARLDDEIEANSMMQSKLAALEEIIGSATTLASPVSSGVDPDVSAGTAACFQNVDNILSNFETQRKAFEETRKVRSEGSRSVVCSYSSSLRARQCYPVFDNRSVVARRRHVVGPKLSHMHTI